MTNVVESMNKKLPFSGLLDETTSLKISIRLWFNQWLIGSMSGVFFSHTLEFKLGMWLCFWDGHWKYATIENCSPI